MLENGSEEHLKTVGYPATSKPIDLELGERKTVKVYAKDFRGNFTETGLSGEIKSTPGTEHFLLRYEHFTAPSPEWRENGYGIITAKNNLGCYTLTRGAKTNHTSGTIALSEAAGAEATASIYVDDEAAGEYTAFMHVEQNGEGFYLNINGRQTSTALGSKAVDESTNGENGRWDWIKADTTFTLTKGWNEVKVTSVSGDDEFTLIYLTKDAKVKTSELTYVTNGTEEVSGGKLNVGIYDDIAAPTFAEEDMQNGR